MAVESHIILKKGNFFGDLRLLSNKYNLHFGAITWELLIPASVK